MIFYFSATGNSKHVVDKIIAGTVEKAVSVLDCSLSEPIEISAGESLGIVSPVYCGGVPYPVVDFLQKANLKVDKNAYVYFVGTYGNLSGRSGSISGKMLKKNIGRTFDATFSVHMPDTWTPVFDLTDVEAVAQMNVKADVEISEVVARIQVQKKGDFMKDKLPIFMEWIYPSFYKTLSKTSNLKVEDNCIGCGLCEKKCPTKAIHMENSKPTWVKENCIMCLGCLHRCPQFAIQYGDTTKDHGQYLHPTYKK